MSLPIISADERLAEKRGVKGVLVGRSGIGKTSQLWTLPARAHPVLRSRSRRSRRRGLAGRHPPAPHLGRVP